MSSIYLKPRTATHPEAISPAGAAVTFTVIARSRPAGRDSQFRFRLDQEDGFTWGDGSLTIERSATLTDGYQPYDFPLTLRRAQDNTTVILRIRVEGELVDAQGQPPSSTKYSLAFLTVGPGFAGVLRQHRSENLLTQNDLGQRVGVSEGWISELENGALPSEELLLRIKEEIEA